MEIDNFLEMALSRSLLRAQKYRHEFVTPEHVVYALISQPTFADAFSSSGGSISDLSCDIRSVLDKLESVPDDIPYTLTESSQLQSILAESHREATEQDCPLSVALFIKSLLTTEESEAAYLIKQGLTSTAAAFVRRLEKTYDRDRELFFSGDDEDVEMDDDEDDMTDTDWHKFVTDITAKAKEHTPLIGREEELDRTLQILCRMEKNNPLHIGDPGVGKTALVYGLAQRIEANGAHIPEQLKGAHIYGMDMGQLIAGTQFRGDFEKRITSILDGAEKEGKVIIYLDEIHNIVGAGRTGDGGPDASNILKPYLESGKLRFIGATTYEDFNRYLSKEKSITRRFQQIDILEPSVEEAIRIVEGLTPAMQDFHHVTYRRDAYEYAVKASAKYITNRHLPDKAIDILDEAGAYLELHPTGKNFVTKAVIRQILTKVCRIEAKALTEEKSADTTKTLCKRILSFIYGQDPAVDKVTDAVLMAKAGLTDDDKPMASLLFVGPTGVGKTEVARVLAKELGIPLVRFDMSEYGEKHTVAKLIGSPAGYVGYEDGGLLTDAIRKSPNCVLLLDEIEKAHSDIYNILLQVMDYAKLTDNRGQKADFRNVILIMTSNAGAQYASQAGIGFGGGISRGNAMLGQVKKTFKPEFINRLSDIVVFKDMDKMMAARILDKKLGKLNEKLQERKIRASYTDAARQRLIDTGFTPEYGAREIDRIINSQLKTRLMREILFGTLCKGGDITVDYRDGQFVFIAKKEENL